MSARVPTADPDPGAPSRPPGALQYALAFAAVLAAWEALSRWLDNPVLPGPAAALAALVQLARSGPLAGHLLVSLGRVVAALGGSLALAWPLGLLMGRRPAADRLLSPVVDLLYPIPKVALLPVVIVLMGLGDLPKIFLIGIISFFQLLLPVRDAVRQINPVLIRSVVSLGAGEWALVRHVLLPAVLPPLFTALRIGVGTAVSVLFLTESFVTERGIGYYLVDAWSRLAYAEMFAAVIGMALLGLALYGVVDGLERWMCPWLWAGEQATGRLSSKKGGRV